MSNSNKKYEDMAEHTKNNRPEKKPKNGCHNNRHRKTASEICNGQLQIPIYPCCSSASF